MLVVDSPLADALRDRYVLEKELGRGGMATVYLARDLRHDRPVALKVLHAQLAATLGPERFLREIRTAARLQHPHILSVHDSGEAAGQLWFTMPYVEGESLRDRLRRERQLPVEDALRITREAAQALHYAHTHGVIHRDVKPENLLLTEDGNTFVADFGVARALEAGEDALTQTGLAVGTPAYMSPEQASGARDLDARSDGYALGCVLYEMLAGEPPYTGPTPQAILARRLTESPRPLGATRERVPAHVEDAVARALARSPADRFPTAAEFARALDAVTPHDAVAAAALSASQAAAPLSAPHAAPGRARRRGPRHWVALGSAALLVVGLGGAAVLWRSRVAPPALDADLLAVAPFDVLDPKLQLWREGLVDLLTRSLDGVGPLRAVPPTTVIRRWGGRADEPSAAELGRKTGARLALFGSLFSTGGDSARLRATLLDVEAGRTLAELELRDAAGRIDRLGDSLAVRVLGELGRTRRIELTGVASLGSTSPPALKAFLQGEQWFRRTAWDSATAAYERAVALDSNFALALWRFGRVMGWQGDNDSLGDALILRAGALNHGLAPRDSLLVAVDSMLLPGTFGTWHGYQRLLATAREAVRRYPDDADAWHTLGEVYVHAGRHVTMRQTLAAFERAIALDSGYAPAYLHAMEFASAIHGLRVSRRYAAEYLRRAPYDVTAEGTRLAFDLADPSRGNTPEVRRRLEGASANVLTKAFLPVAGAVDSGEVAVRLARALAATPESSAVAWGRGVFGFTLAYRGHLAEASAAWRPDLIGAPLLLAELALLGAYPPDSAAAHFDRWLGAGDLRQARDGLPWWATRGDAAAILRFERLADSVAKGSTEPALREEGLFGAEAARAYLALARRDTAEALRRFERLPDSLCGECGYEAVVRQRLEAVRGHDRRVLDEADRWAFAHTAYLELVRTASEVLRSLDVARAAEQLGDRERATRGYQFVLDAWRHADPELQPYVAEARRALERLTGEPGS